MNTLTQIDESRVSIRKCQQFLDAIGNKSRFDIVYTLLDGDFKGMRIGEIARRSKLSRPTVTHHLKVLLDTEVIGIYSKGTRNYYYIKLGGEWQEVVMFINLAEKIRSKKYAEKIENVS